VNVQASRTLIHGAAALALGFTGLGVGGATPASAEPSDAEPGLMEVTVTARKRAESLQEVPISVSAFTSERLEQLNLKDLNAIQRFTPGLSFEQTAFNTSVRFLPQIRFRGMSTNAPQLNAQVGAVFQDGVFVLAGAQSISTEDAERVEILKGPQNTYFGRNTFGGAINFVTRTPSDSFSAEAKLRLEQRDTYGVTGSLEGPLAGDWLSGRLIVSKWQDGAHYRSGDGGDLGRQETQYVAGTLFFEFAERLKIRVRGHLQQDSDYGNANFALRTQADFANCRPAALNWYCGAAPKLGDSVALINGASRVVPPAGIWSDTSLQPAQLAAIGRGDALAAFLSNATGIMNDIPFYGDLPEIDHFGGERDLQRIAANWSYEFEGGASLAGNVGYGATQFVGFSDTDQTPGLLPSAPLPVYVYTPLKTSDISAEIRLVSDQDRRLRWLVGASTFRIKVDGSTGSAIKTINARTGLPNTNPWQNSDRDRSEVNGVFAAVSYDILPTLTADVEARYQRDQLKSFQQVAPGTFLPIFRTFKDTLPRGILSWKPVPTTNLYASWSRGALPGLANSLFENLVNTTAAFTANPVGTTDRDEIRRQLSGLLGVDVPLTLESERVDQIEIGWKQEFLEGRAFTNLALYQLEWSNQKQPATAVLANARLPNGRVIPANGDLNGDGTSDGLSVRIPGGSKIHGVELEAGYRPIDPLTLTLSGEWVDSGYEGFFPGGALVANYSGLRDLNGKTLFMYPTTKLAASARWEAPLRERLRWYAQGTASYTGKIYADEANLSWIDPNTLVNASVGVTAEKYTVELYGNNLTGFDGWLNGRRNTMPDNTQSLALVPARKRVVGVRVDLRF
jgi:iron complex outermembrane receptor protein